MTSIRTATADKHASASSFSNRNPAVPLSTNAHLLNWVDKMANLTKPDAIHWVDGSQEEDAILKAQMVTGGTFTKLNEELWPGCYYARSDPSDVARVEDRTFICSLSKDAAGPTNNWEEPYQMRRKLKELFDGSMRGRTMYVLPFSMGPIGSPMSQIGVQLTDSPYVVVNMRIMARIGLPVYAEIDKDYKRVVPCMHSVGAPLTTGQTDVPWPCNKEISWSERPLIVFCCPLIFSVTLWFWGFTETTEPDTVRLPFDPFVPTPAQAVNKAISARIAIPITKCRITCCFIESLLLFSNIYP